MSIHHLEEGHILLYPTDTVWGLGCDAYNEAAIDKIFKIKKRSKEKGMVVLVDALAMLKQYVGSIPPEVKSIVDLEDAPTSVIYPKCTLPKHLLADDGSAAIRIVQHPLIQQIISGFGLPIISTSANHSGQAVPMDLRSVHPEIARSVHFCIPSEYDVSEQKIPSRIIKVESSGAIKHIR